MSFRTIVISSRCKLEYSLNYLVCKKSESTSRIILDEIKTIIINSPQVVITSCLISECLNKKIKIVFTDEKRNPCGEIVGYYNNSYTYRKIKEQLLFNDENKNLLWKYIIEKKIFNQAHNLMLRNLMDKYYMLLEYSQNVDYGDASNREGHAAKVYFNALFGNEFNRDKDCFINAALNYGYSIILSSINREIKALGYLTEFGIHHIGESNPFNLSCDLIEPLRPLIDKCVVMNQVNETNYKNFFVNLLSTNVKYNNKDIILENAIHLYVNDLLAFLKTGNIERIRFIDYEF